MNKPSKCKNCQWYGKPYWSIINPCDSCPNENDYKTIIQIDGVPVIKETLTEEEIKKAMTDKSIFELTIEEKDKEIERLNNIIKEYKTNTIPTLEHNIDVLVDSEERLNNIIYELEKYFIEKFNETQDTRYCDDLIKLKELKEGNKDE